MPDAKKPSFSVDKEWFDTRAKELGLSQRKLSKALVMDHGGLSLRLEGRRSFRANEVAELSQIFKVSSGEILRRMGFQAPGLQVRGCVVDGRLAPVSELNGTSVEFSPATPGAVASNFQSEKNDPYSGGYLIWSPEDDLAIEFAHGRLCVVEIPGEMLQVLGVITRGNTPNTLSVDIFGTTETIETDTISKAYRVLAVLLP